MATAKALPAVDARQLTKGKTKDVGQISQFTLMRRRFMSNYLSVVGLIILIIMYLVAAFAPFLSPYPADLLDSNAQYAAPTQVHLINGQLSICSLTQSLDQNTFTWIYTTDCTKAKPINFFTHGFQYKILGVFGSDLHLFGVDPPEKLFLIGADNQGRDMLSRILVGSGVSMTVGLVGVTIVIILGSILGTASGYFGGAIDNLIQRFIELLSSMPTLPLFAAMAAALPQDMSVTQRFFLITIILSLIGWTGLARQVRGKVLAYRNLDYTSAARLAGASGPRIILTHMLPNAVSHIIVVAAFAIPATILGETSLSFLGLGMLPPAISWGVLLRDAQNIQAVEQHTWLLSPAIPVILAVTSYQLLADGLRDAADPYSS